MIAAMAPEEPVASTIRASAISASEVADPSFLAAVAEPQRMRLLARLLDLGAAMTVSELAGESPVHVSVVSRHLRQLEQAGLGSSTRAGRTVLYEAERVHFSTILGRIANAVDTEIRTGVGDDG